MPPVMMNRDAILRSRWLRPFTHLFEHPSLWHLNRRSFPRALAIGLFAAFAVPLGQFALASLLAVPLRANVPLAVGATLVTNPFTFPPIFFGAYQTGRFLLPAGAQADDLSDHLLGWILSLTGPTALGLMVFAIAGALSGYALGTLFWRLKLTRRWRRRGDRAEP